MAKKGKEEHDRRSPCPLSCGLDLFGDRLPARAKETALDARRRRTVSPSGSGFPFPSAEECGEHRYGPSRLASPNHVPIRRVGEARRVSASLFTFTGLNGNARSSGESFGESPGQLVMVQPVAAQPAGRTRPLGAQSMPTAMPTAMRTAMRTERPPIVVTASGSTLLSYAFVTIALACTFLV